MTILKGFGLVMLGAVSMYVLSPRAKFYVHHGIWLPAFCSNFHFDEYPDLNSLFGKDGAHTSSSFDIERDDTQRLIDHIAPQIIWIMYSRLDTTMKDGELKCPCILPRAVFEERPRTVLYSSDTKGDFYNIILDQDSSDIVRVTIYMPFT